MYQSRRIVTISPLGHLNEQIITANWWTVEEHTTVPFSKDQVPQLYSYTTFKDRVVQEIFANLYKMVSVRRTHWSDISRTIGGKFFVGSIFVTNDNRCQPRHIGKLLRATKKIHIKEDHHKINSQCCATLTTVRPMLKPIASCGNLVSAKRQSYTKPCRLSIGMDASRRLARYCSSFKRYSFPMEGAKCDNSVRNDAKRPETLDMVM